MAVFDVAAEGSSGAEAPEEVTVAQPVLEVALATAAAESLELTFPSVASASVLQPQQEEAQEEQQHSREQDQEEQQQPEEMGGLEEEQPREQEQQQAQQSEQEEQQAQHEEEREEEGEEEEQQQPSPTEPGSGGLGVLLVHHNMLYSLKDAEQHTSACSSAQASVTCLDLRPKGPAPGPQHLSAGRHIGDLELTQQDDGLYGYDSGDEGDGDVRVGGSMDSQQDEVHSSPGTPDSLAALSASYRTGHSSGSNEADSSPAAVSCSCSVQMFRQARGSGPQGLLDSQLGANSSGLGYSDTTTGCSGGESSCSAKKRPRELVALPFTSLEQLEAGEGAPEWSDLEGSRGGPHSQASSTTPTSAAPLTKRRLVEAGRGGRAATAAKRPIPHAAASALSHLRTWGQALSQSSTKVQHPGAAGAASTTQPDAGTDCEAPAAAASFTSQGTPHPPTTHLILKDQPGALSSVHPKPFVFKFSEDHLPDRLAGSVGPLHHLQQSKVLAAQAVVDGVGLHIAPIIALPSLKTPQATSSA
ncbi:hypothetical protein HaLaN_07759 [Haematococcus lacustris]|uniref:Uncharacterized protein n=1 Tax=Haematococcus lacustris TaxID=44745 RepID=A0A699YPB5_HAELA|nr:hypothetical protein HaLaN_07759 [Haematococcus lacustris]